MLPKVYVVSETDLAKFGITVNSKDLVQETVDVIKSMLERPAMFTRNPTNTSILELIDWEMRLLISYCLPNSKNELLKFCQSVGLGSAIGNFMLIYENGPNSPEKTHDNFMADLKDHVMAFIIWLENRVKQN